MDRGCPLDLLDSVRPQRASGTRPYGAPALGGIGVVVCGFAVRPLMFQGNGNTRGGECNPPTGDLIPAGPQAARLCRVVASPHISPIVAKTRIGANWRLESCRKDRKPRGCMGCGAYKASVGKPLAPGRLERGPGVDAETHRGNTGGKPTISGQSRFSTPAAAHAGGPADCAARSHRGAGRGGRRKATATPCAW